MKIESYKLSRIRKEDLPRLLELTNFEDSSMKRFLLDRKSYNIRGRVFIKREQNIVGWSISIRVGFRSLQVHTFVDPLFRRRGIGTELCKAALESVKGRAAVYPATGRAEKFYKSVGFEKKIYGNVINRWEHAV